MINRLLLALAGVAVVFAFKAVDRPIWFENTIAQSGIVFSVENAASPEKHQIETMTGGVAVFDYNNDGLLDLYFVNGASLPDMKKSGPQYFNRLYRNDGNGKFTDVTAEAGIAGVGYGIGVAAGDYDNDGFEDIYVVGVNANQLLHNNGDGTFRDVTQRARVTGLLPKIGKPFAVGAGWFDYNNDGLLDLLVINYVNWSIDREPDCRVNGIRTYCSPDSYEGLPNILYRNNGDGTFTDVSESSGIGKLVGKGMGVAFADYDRDGFTDVFIANDTFRNFLLHNNGNGTFSEVGILAGVAYNEHGKSIAGMGTDFRDIDNDGRPDIFVTGMIGDTFPLFGNTGHEFTDLTSTSGIAAATGRLTGWSAGAFDFDNDGWKDLFTANASILDNSERIDHLPYPLPNLLLRNAGHGKFINATRASGLDRASPHRGAAFGDLDNDGRIDIVTTSLNAQPEIWMNQSTVKHWLSVKLEGTRSNRDGLGAEIQLRTGAVTQYNHATTAVGYASSSDRRVHFGLGAASTIDELTVKWPSGKVQLIRRVKADQIFTVKEP